FALWAASHIPVNGEGAPVILFSHLLALSVYGPISMNRKRRRALGETEWARLNSGGKSMSGANGWIAGLFGGGGLYILFLYIHETVIGVSPLP
ncbi:MAG: NnrU family protein, partial [Rhodospirillales bacterium]|nr:NnrU family protein [Rhodospirillales bacterium]